MDALERLLSKVRYRDKCWIYTGYCDKRGYGMFWLNGTMVQAHIASYRLHIGSVSKGLQLDHLCLNKSCINPIPLEPVTALENKQRATRLRMHCKNNHKYTKENTRIEKASNGSTRRVCLTCQKERHQQHYSRVKEAVEADKMRTHNKT